jgi:hypothetical protein
VELRDVVLDNCHFSWDDTHKLTTADRLAVIYVCQLTHFSWEHLHPDGALTPGINAAIQAQFYDGVRLAGNVQEALDLAVAARVPFIHNEAITNSQQWNIELEQTGKWRGGFVQIFNSGTQDVSADWGASAVGVLKGCVLQYEFADGFVGTADTGLPLAGIAATSMIASNLVPIIRASTQCIPVRVDTAVAVTNNHFAKKAANGCIAQASGIADGTIVGWVISTAADAANGETFRNSLVQLLKP